MTHLTNFLKLATIIGVALVSLAAASHGPASWTDPQNGIALGGFDPIAYRTHRRPLQGVEELEHYWGGVTWRFVNTGNLAAFSKDPEVYAPKFAGYDAFSLANNRLVHGSPAIWEVYRDELFLFSSFTNRNKWRKNRSNILTKVESAWPKLAKERQDYWAPPPLADHYPRKTP